MRDVGIDVDVVVAVVVVRMWECCLRWGGGSLRAMAGS